MTDLSPFFFEDEAGPYLVCTARVTDDRGVGYVCHGRQRLDESGERWICPDCGSSTKHWPEDEHDA